MAETTSHLQTGQDPRRAARSLYWRGWGVTQLAEELGLKRATVESWKQRDRWDDAPSIQKMEDCLETRFMALVAKDAKTGGDFKEIDLLGRQAERLARVRRYDAGGNEADLNPNIEARNAKPKKPAKRNYFDEDQVAALRQALEDSLYGHQRDWMASSALRTRVILKARQIGATLYFAREALLKALETGHNQVFLSASKAQALHFRQYIVDFAYAVTGVKLTGDPIVIDRGEGQESVTLYFLGTNYRTAQGYHGDFYFDEFFWVHGFEQISKVASGIAMQKKYRKTYFSTPSSVNHEAYPFWTGEARNKNRRKDKRVEIDVSHKALKDGQLGPDRIWRQIVTILDAIGKGYDLFDLDELRDEYSEADFANLLMCGFIDDTESTFPLAALLKCTVDAFETWTDFDFYAALEGQRAYSGEVWLSYDPSESADSAGCVVLAPPTTPGGRFRVLERFQWWGNDFDAQAEEIRKLTARYNVTKIRIDATGLGAAVYQLVKAWFPTVEGLKYTAELKVAMVQKTLDTMRRGRLEFDTAAVDLMSAMITVRKVMTESGRAMTYESPRSKITGHADLAWALMQGLHIEPLAAPIAGEATKSRMEIF
jgi:uncharacterized protein YjcR